MAGCSKDGLKVWPPICLRLVLKRASWQIQSRYWPIWPDDRDGDESSVGVETLGDTTSLLFSFVVDFEVPSEPVVVEVDDAIDFKLDAVLADVVAEVDGLLVVVGKEQKVEENGLLMNLF